MEGSFSPDAFRQVAFESGASGNKSIGAEACSHKSIRSFQGSTEYEPRMILAVDVQYREPDATVAGVLFAQWNDAQPAARYALVCDGIADYVPGEFYRRELPCIHRLIDALGPVALSCIVIDGYVALGEEQRPGLGAHLWQSLDERIAVIGVAKSRFLGTPEQAELRRGDSQRPLFVSAAGLPLAQAREAIAAMAGAHRLPDLLKLVDRLARGLES
ncbi:MAG: endonuclease V [Lysobacter sp.]